MQVVDFQTDLGLSIVKSLARTRPPGASQKDFSGPPVAKNDRGGTLIAHEAFRCIVRLGTLPKVPGAASAAWASASKGLGI